VCSDRAVAAEEGEGGRRGARHDDAGEDEKGEDGGVEKDQTLTSSNEDSKMTLGGRIVEMQRSS